MSKDELACNNYASKLCLSGWRDEELILCKGLLVAAVEKVLFFIERFSMFILLYTM
jgi:hypothetical protein